MAYLIAQATNQNESSLTVLLPPRAGSPTRIYGLNAYQKTTATNNAAPTGVTINGLMNGYTGPSASSLGLIHTGEVGGGTLRFQRRSRVDQLFWDGRLTGLPGTTVTIAYIGSVPGTFEKGLMVWYGYG